MNFLPKNEVMEVLTKDSGAFIRVQELEPGKITRYVFESNNPCTIGEITEQDFNALPLKRVNENRYADPLNDFLRLIGGNSFDEIDYKLR